MTTEKKPRKPRSDRNTRRVPKKVSLVIPTEWAEFCSPKRKILQAYKHRRDWWSWTILSYCMEENVYYVSDYVGFDNGEESSVQSWPVMGPSVAEQKEARDSATSAYLLRCAALG